MAQKLWEKNTQVNTDVERYTVGHDREMDLYLARYDVLGSLAHIAMLQTIGLLSADELKVLTEELRNIYALIEQGDFSIEAGVEDIHSQIELMLTRKLGDIGKKIHSGRSRNDQVLVDLKLFIRSQLREVVQDTKALFDTLIDQSYRYRNVLMPGYTHLQVAMPSSFGLWFGAYAESLVDDLIVVQSAYRISNRNPLGSAAGYGSSFPLNRTFTTDALGFESMDYNVVYAQMGRGKTERIVASALASIAATLSKLSFDACLFNSQNFGFIKLPDEYTTGSSIMPHKKNPDVFELTRARCNKLQSLPYQITLIANNLPSGYFRDMQMIKEIFLPAFDELRECLRMVTRMISEIEVNDRILDDERYKYMFSVEEVNRLARSGVPFRDAYKQVGLAIEAGEFEPCKTIEHTHEGSIGNLCNDRISMLMQQIISEFDFSRIDRAEARLLGKEL
jgi:argininosuccinate lyase